MYLPLGNFSPEIKLGLVSASRNCFPRSLSEKRTKNLLAACKNKRTGLFIPKGTCQIIETRTQARAAARQMEKAGCDAAVLYLGNFSPEIEDSVFVKEFAGPVMIIAAAEESVQSISCGDRGDALCGLLSAALAVSNRQLKQKLHIPEQPLVNAEQGAAEIAEFIRIMKVVKGVQNACIGLFGPRPRDFETCNYNLASLLSLGVEVEELGFHDLVAAVEKMKSKDLKGTIASLRREIKGTPGKEFAQRLAAYELALLSFREQLKLSGAATQCWSAQELTLQHVPCTINARLAARGFPVACENDAYSLVAELLGQYATDAAVTILDINHTIPDKFDKKLKGIPAEDLVGLFHCGNTAVKRMKQAEMKYQVIMKRLMEPKGEPDITRGTLEGQIKASPLTLVQIQGRGDGIQAYLAEGRFLDVDPRTFGATGVAHIPGFRRFYRHVMLGNFHHHTAVAFGHCGATLYEALKLLGVEAIHTPQPEQIPYPGENTFRNKS
jgi:L-fucose isomerase-like protein